MCEHIIGRIGGQVLNKKDYLDEFEKMVIRINQFNESEAKPWPGHHQLFDFCINCGADLREDATKIKA